MDFGARGQQPAPWNDGTSVRVRPLATQATLRQLCSKIACKPPCSMLDNGFQGSRLREEMTRTRNDLQCLRTFQTRQGPLVEFDHAIVHAAHDQEGWRGN